MKIPQVAPAWRRQLQTTRDARRPHETPRAVKRALASGEEAGWTLREAAWDFEEKYLWKGGDFARSALRQAKRLSHPLQRQVQTRLTWPLADALTDTSDWTKAAVAAGAATLAIAAGGAGVVAASHHDPAARHQDATRSATALVAPTPALQGVTPDFTTGKAAATPAPQSSPAPTSTNSASPTAIPVPGPDSEEARVAWQFSQAFVAYEVGRSDKKTAAVLGDTATKQLQQSLAKDPPRLPRKGKVPQARVVNVVFADATKGQVTASVSLLRLSATSELRLTLVKAGKSWRVAQVLG